MVYIYQMNHVNSSKGYATMTAP